MDGARGTQRSSEKVILYKVSVRAPEGRTNGT